MVRARDWIREHYPHAGSDVQPASLDLRLGKDAIVFDWPWRYRLGWTLLGWLERLVQFLRVDLHPLTRDRDRGLYGLLVRVRDARVRLSKRKRHVELTDGYWLKPGEMALLSSSYPVHIPEDSVAFLTLKSSRGREGIDHALAGFFDNGFHGDAVFEVYAHAHPVRIYEGMPFAQLVFMASELPDRPYDGHYQGQRGPTVSWSDIA